MRNAVVFMLLLFFGITVWALRPEGQNNRAEDSRKKSESRVYLLHADKLYFDQYINPEAQILVGNVRFRHDGVLMYCDSALYFEGSSSFNAFGHVKMVQGDTLTLTGDQMYYDGIEQLARVRNNVVLTHRKTILYTDSLNYDRLFDLGYFFKGGRLLDQDNELTSEWGEYSPATREAVFNEVVKLVNPAPPKAAKTILLSDTLHYNTRTAIAHVIGPSTIDNGDSHCYTELGFYNSKTNNFYVLNRSILSNGAKKLIGDSVCWNDADSVGEAFGDAVYTDNVNKNMMTGEYCYYNDPHGFAYGTGKARLVDYSQQDTMYMHGDTIKMFTYNINTDSVYRDMHAYPHVRAFRTDIQAVCDSLVFTGKDTVMTMYKDPIIWMNSQQLLGEEIKAFFNDSTLDSVQVLRQALSAEEMDTVCFNQIAGREIHSYFRQGDIYLTHVIGNVLLNYYPLDDDSLMIGMNHTESSEMKMFMDENKKVDYIWMPQATGTLYPLLKTPPETRFLENFQWFDYMRPIDKDDIFEWRPKKAGTELKASRVRQAPLQKLSDVQGKIKKKK